MSDTSTKFVNWLGRDEKGPVLDALSAGMPKSLHDVHGRYPIGRCKRAQHPNGGGQRQHHHHFNFDENRIGAPLIAAEIADDEASKSHELCPSRR